MSHWRSARAQAGKGLGRTFVSIGQAGLLKRGAAPFHERRVAVRQAAHIGLGGKAGIDAQNRLCGPPGVRLPVGLGMNHRQHDMGQVHVRIGRDRRAAGGDGLVLAF